MVWMIRAVLAAAILLTGEAFAQEPEEPAAEPPIASTIIDPDVRARLDEAVATDMEADPAGALAAWRAAFHAAAAAAPEDTLALAQIRNQLGAAMFYAGEREAALSHFQAAAAAFENAGSEWAEPRQEALGNVGSILATLGQLEEAEAVQREALALRRTLYPENHPQIARSYFEIGSVLNAQGRADEASLLIVRSLEIRRETLGEDHPHVAMTQVSLASILTSARRYEEALEAARTGLETLEANLPEGHPFIGFAKSNYAGALNAAGRHRQAEPFLRAIVAERRDALGDDHPQVADSLNNLAVALNALGNRSEARTLFLAAREIYLSAGGADSPIAARMRANAADLAGPDAISEMQAALADFERIGVTGGEPRMLLLSRLAVRLAQSGRIIPALARLTEAQALAEALYPDGHETRLALVIDEAWIRAAESEHAADALALARPAALALMQSSILDVDRSLDAAVRADEALRRALDVAFAAGDEAFIAALLDSGGARSMRLAAEAAQARGEGAARDLLRRRQDAARRVRLAEERYIRLRASGGSLEYIQATAAERAAALSDLEAAESALGQTVPARQSPDLEALQASLAADEALLAFAFTERGGVAMALSREARAISRLAIDEAAAAAAVASLRGALSAGAGAFRSTNLQTETRELVAFPAAAAHQLYSGVFTDQVSAVVDGKQRLVTLVDGPYISVPFSVLLTEPAGDSHSDPAVLRNAPWLARRYGVVSATRLAAPQSQARSGVERLFAAGAPAFTGGEAARLDAVLRGGAVNAEAVSRLPALPGAAEELTRLQTLFGTDRSTIVSGAAATEPAVGGADLERADVVVFATHGLLPGELDGVYEPALAFLPDPASGADGLLTASEIAALRLSADWVVLSACNTFVEGRTAPPDQLAEAFFYAGADSLMVSHWAVRDDIAARMIADIAELSSGLDRAEAHRRAMLALIDDESLPGGAHPGVWGPFALIAR